VLGHQPSLFGAAPSSLFDLAIMNPPYFKVRKDSESARAMAHVVHGQPNIYAFFMAVAVDLLRDGGELVAITPGVTSTGRTSSASANGSSTE